MDSDNQTADLLVLPPWEPAQTWVLVIDCLSFVLPICAAGMSIWSGLSAIHGIDKRAATLGIMAGIFSAFGVIATGVASRIRDDRLRQTHLVGTQGLNTAQTALDAMYPGFGG